MLKTIIICILMTITVSCMGGEHIPLMSNNSFKWAKSLHTLDLVQTINFCFQPISKVIYLRVQLFLVWRLEIKIKSVKDDLVQQQCVHNKYIYILSGNILNKPGSIGWIVYLSESSLSSSIWGTWWTCFQSKPSLFLKMMEVLSIP